MKKKLITIILTAILVILPIAIIPDAKDYTQIKMWALLASGLILLILLLLNYKEFNIDKQDAILLVYAALIFISTMYSDNVSVSIFGTKYRYEGMLALYTYIIIYFCSKKFLNYKNKNTLLYVFQAVYIAISILSIFQYYIILPQNKLKPIFNKGACGTFGNTNFMGNFASMGIPIFVINYILKNNKLSLVTSLLVFFSLIACNARSGWVAFIAFSIILIIYLVKNKKWEYFKRAIILAVGFVLIFAIIYTSSKGKNPLRNKFSAIKDDIEIVKTDGIKNKLGSNRIQIWNIVLELIPKYPILGVGTDNLKNGILQNLTQNSINFINENRSVIDKAHNEYLQIAATLGIPALIVYTVFICSIIFPKLPKFFKQENVFLILCVIGSYFIQAFFNISTIGIAPIFWFMLGIANNKNINYNVIEGEKKI